jgi:hypothetical protein
MPEEIEVPTEHLHEHIQEKVHHEGGDFNMTVALSSAILAVLAAVAALMAGHAANEAMLLQLQGSDQWAYYQSKGIKSAVLESKMDVLEALKKPGNPEDAQKKAKYKEEMDKIAEKAKELSDESGAEMSKHVILARAVTFFQISIALSAMAILAKKKVLWFTSLGLGAVGLVFFIGGIL